MNLSDRTYLWQHLGHRPTDDPAKLRWDAQDYRDAADLHFGHDPELQQILRDCAAKNQAAADMIERDRIPYLPHHVWKTAVES